MRHAHISEYGVFCTEKLKVLPQMTGKIVKTKIKLGQWKSRAGGRNKKTNQAINITSISPVFCANKLYDNLKFAFREINPL